MNTRTGLSVALSAAIIGLAACGSGGAASGPTDEQIAELAGHVRSGSEDVYDEKAATCVATKLYEDLPDVAKKAAEEGKAFDPTKADIKPEDAERLVEIAMFDCLDFGQTIVKQVGLTDEDTVACVTKFLEENRAAALTAITDQMINDDETKGAALFGEMREECQG